MLTPSNNKMKIGFYTAGLPFTSDALEKGPLGGSETAFIQITRALKRRGHEVWVFNHCEKVNSACGITYHPFRKSLTLLAKEDFDVFVVSRFFGFFNLPIKSELKVLWNHDTLDNPKELRAVHDEIDLCLVLSQFHKDNYMLRLPALNDRLVVTRNGLDFNLMDQAAANVTKDPHKLIYASRPERGLKVLLEQIWPRLYQANPQLRLYLCGYNVPKDGLPPALLELYEHLELLVQKSPGVINLGSLSKSDYYRHLAEATMMLYPSTFPEVSCLAALEAQALGTVILTSDSFALSESVVLPPMKVAGRPGSLAYIQDYVERALLLLSRQQHLLELAQNAQSIIRSRYSWDLVAAEWERLFSLSLKAKLLTSNAMEKVPDSYAHLI